VSSSQPHSLSGSQSKNEIQYPFCEQLRGHASSGLGVVVVGLVVGVTVVGGVVVVVVVVVVGFLVVVVVVVVGLVDGRVGGGLQPAFSGTSQMPLS